MRAAEQLPMDSAFAPVLAREPAPAPIGGRALVLVVDDNADMRGYLAQLIGHEHEVQVVTDGWQALQAIHERMPDLVLTDVMMAGLDGFGLLQRLRADAATAALPVVMLSANAGHSYRLQALEAGADDFLVKPFHARELLARVSATLRLAQVRREAMQREQALRAEVQGMLESITDAFVAVDEQWCFSYVNSAAEAIFGRSRESMLGRNYWELFPAVPGVGVRGAVAPRDARAGRAQRRRPLRPARRLVRDRGLSAGIGRAGLLLPRRAAVAADGARHPRKRIAAAVPGRVRRTDAAHRRPRGRPRRRRPGPRAAPARRSLLLGAGG